MDVRANLFFGAVQQADLASDVTLNSAGLSDLLAIDLKNGNLRG